MSDKYWYVDSRTYIRNKVDEGLDYDKRRMEIGNYFKSEQEARFAMLKIREALKGD